MRVGQFLLVAMLAGVLGVSVAISAKDATIMHAKTRTMTTVRLLVEGDMPALGGATAWLNSGPLNTAELRGNVVLINFWTFTRINWLRELPYVRAWADKYREQGLIVIGVHSSEFEFEKSIDDISQFMRDRRIRYPVAVDSGQWIWRSFGNRRWPSRYVVDAQGRIRHQQSGEGGYEQSEQVIQQLLREAGRSEIDRGFVSVNGRGVEAAADWASLRSPENYLGYARTVSFVSPGGVIRDAPNHYNGKATPPLNSWSLDGVWTIGREFAVLNGGSGYMTYRFQARDLHLVMAPSMPGRSVRFRVKLDGNAPGDNHGGDVDAAGWGTLREGRLYQLIRQSGPITKRTFEIEFLEPGVRAYAFTFG